MAYSTITKPADYFNTKIYTGTGSTNAITGVGFQPDFTWIKNRTSTYQHQLYDSVRGATKKLQSSNTGAETTDATALTSFDSDGFTVGSNVGVNENTSNHVGWNWLAGGTASSNTDGSITSSVSANTTAGFSIVSWTGTGVAGTIGHGLGTAPDVMIIKNRDNTNGWIVYHSGLSAPATSFLLLNTTDAVYTGVSDWQSTAPTSSVFSVSNATGVNNTSEKYIGYCFTSKKGFSKFGSYIGNGSDVDGTFIYTGFKPAWVMTKKITDNVSANWLIQTADGLNPYNPVNQQSLRANLTNAALNAYAMDFLSNGIKMYNDSSNANETSKEFIYMAFAENPLVTSSGVPATAR